MTTLAVAHPRLPQGILQAVTAPFRMIGVFFATIMDNNYRLRQLEHLNRMSDEALAARGLTREGLVKHVFKDTFHL